MTGAMMTKPTRSAGAPISALLGRPYPILTLTSLFWGGNMVAGKMAVGQIDPYTLIVLRWLGALVLVISFALPHLRTDWPAIRRWWPLLLLYGGLGYATFNVLMYVAVHYTSAVNASIEQALIPVLVIIGNFTVFRVRARLLQLAGVVLTIIGVAMTAVHGDFGALGAATLNFGDVLVVLACIAYAIHSLALRWRPAMHWLSFLAATFLAALLAGVVFEVVFGGGAAAIVTGVAAATPQGWLIVVYVAFFPSVLSQLFYARGVELIGANRASLFINLIPLFGVVGSIIVLGEQLQSFHVVAAVLIVAGILIAEWSAPAAGTASSEASTASPPPSTLRSTSPSMPLTRPFWWYCNNSQPSEAGCHASERTHAGRAGTASP